jgi:outer membrane lipoprotein-sorting protein
VRLTGLAGGAPIATYAAEAVQVNAALPDDVFEFRPPPGTRVARVVWRG